MRSARQLSQEAVIFFYFLTLCLGVSVAKFSSSFNRQRVYRRGDSAGHGQCRRDEHELIALILCAIFASSFRKNISPTVRPMIGMEIQCQG